MPPHQLSSEGPSNRRTHKNRKIGYQMGESTLCEALCPRVKSVSFFMYEIERKEHSLLIVRAVSAKMFFVIEK